MKIKSQFRLLLAGIIIIPLALIFIMFFQNYTNSPKRLIIPGYDELVGSSNYDFQVDPESWKIVQKKLSRRPEGLEYLIFDKNYNLVLSNFTDLTTQLHSENNQYSSGEIFAFSKNEDSIIYKFVRAFLFYGGITGGLAFSVFPTTSLMVFPLLQYLNLSGIELFFQINTG